MTKASLKEVREYQEKEISRVAAQLRYLKNVYKSLSR